MATTAPDVPGGVVRAVLWVLLVISTAAVLVASKSDAGRGVNLAFALAGLTCGAVLIVHHYRNRRR